MRKMRGSLRAWSRRWARSGTASTTRWPRASSPPSNASCSTARTSTTITTRAEPSSSSSRDGIIHIVVTGALVSNPRWPSRGVTRQRHETQALNRPLKRGNSNDALEPVRGDVHGAGVGAEQLARHRGQPGHASHKLYHLGVGSVARSSLARVNEEQPYRLHERMFERVLARCQRSAPGHGFRFKSKRYSLDASTVDLCLSMFPWARFKRAKGR